MEDLSEMSLEELLNTARRVNAIDSWEVLNGAVVLQLSTMRVVLDRKAAETFVRGLLRRLQTETSRGRTGTERND